MTLEFFRCEVCNNVIIQGNEIDLAHRVVINC